MVQCPECGKELIHRGALNGHRAFKHGVLTEKAHKLDELRIEVKSLHQTVDEIVNALGLIFDKSGKIIPNIKIVRTKDN
jgi:hypothetical protein